MESSRSWILLALVGSMLAAVLGCGGGGASERPALVLALAQFGDKPGKGGAPQPLPAGLEFLVEQPDGSWRLTTADDPQSNVFHKAMAYDDGTAVRLLTAAGSEATPKKLGVGTTARGRRG